MHEGALNNAIYHAQKGRAMQMQGITLKVHTVGAVILALVGGSCTDRNLLVLSILELSFLQIFCLFLWLNFGSCII